MFHCPKLCRSQVIPAVMAVVSLGCEEEPPPPVYQLVPMTTRDIVVSASAAGIVEPVKTVEVKSKASGEIMDVRVETGDEVRRGDLLVSVDPRVPRNAVVQAEADLEVAKAQLENATSQLERAETLHETQLITDTDYEAARLEFANAKAQLVRAERSLEDARIAFEDTEVRAPSSGVILAKNIEVGTVISSATREVGGGTVLLTMANLDTVQVRSLVDETDIGKIQPGLAVTITVDAYPNQPFRGRVLKIEPQAEVQQNVTMFPVLVRIGNTNGLLKPGMNSEVEIHIGSRQNVLAIPNSALRTQRDVASAATVLGLDMAAVQSQLAASREGSGGQRRATFGATSETGEDNGGGDEAPSNTVTFRGREIQLPPGITREQFEPIQQKMAQGGFQALSSAERSLLRRVMSAAGGPGAGRREQHQQDNNFQFGGTYIVFAMRAAGPEAVEIKTGLTDLDYAEVTEGLAASDTVLILPSASLIQSQQEFQERVNRVTGGGGLPGVRRQGGN